MLKSPYPRASHDASCDIYLDTHRQLETSTWSYGYTRTETLSGPIGGPAQVTTDRRDSRAFRVSRLGGKTILTFVGPDDDRREYDGLFFTLIQNGEVVRKWRRVE